MFRNTLQRNFARFNSSSGHVSKFISENAFPKADKQAGEAFKKTYEGKVAHSGTVSNTWKRLTYIVALPAILLAAIPVGNVELKHADHRKHLREVPDDEWPTQYDYQNIRSRKFFWGDGDKTLFWNPDINRHIQ